VEWQFGYAGGIQSDTYGGMLVSATPSFIVDGIALEIEAITGDPNGRANVIKKTRSFPNEINQGSSEKWVTTSDIVLSIAEKNHWATTGHPTFNGNLVEPTREVLVFDEGAGTNPVPRRYTQTRMTDLQFITNQLCPGSVTKKGGDEGGMGGYVFFLETINKITYCHFHPLLTEGNDTSRIFEYMRGVNSEVLDFQLDFSGAPWVALNGAHEIAIPYTDYMIGQQAYHVIGDKETPDKRLLGGGKVGKNIVSIKLKQVGPTQMFPPSPNLAAADVEARAAYFKAFYTIFKANLTIMGDDSPDLQMFKIIEVQVRTPGGLMHYSSGKYIIMGRLDVVDGGTWKTTLSLTREGPQEVAG
jgi:hypothetical protein